MPPELETYSMYSRPSLVYIPSPYSISAASCLQQQSFGECGMKRKRDEYEDNSEDDSVLCHTLMQACYNKLQKIPASRKGRQRSPSLRRSVLLFNMLNSLQSGITVGHIPSLQNPGNSDSLWNLPECASQTINSSSHYDHCVPEMLCSKPALNDGETADSTEQQTTVNDSNCTYSLDCVTDSIPSARQDGAGEYLSDELMDCEMSLFGFDDIPKTVATIDELTSTVLSQSHGDWFDLIDSDLEYLIHVLVDS